MNYKAFLKTITRINQIAADNEILVEDVAVRITTTSGQTIKAWVVEINWTDNEILEIFTDDSYTFLPYNSIESVRI